MKWIFLCSFLFLFSTVQARGSAAFKTIEEKRKFELDILNAHNEARRLVAKGEFVKNNVKKPSANNMIELVWDKTLALQATSWALQCTTSSDVHEPNRDDVGENFYARSPPSSPNPHQAVDSWISEPWDENTTKLTENEPNLHLTQVVWASTRRLGCGVAVCDQWMRIFCRYSPSGNYRQADVYTIGKACSACGKHSPSTNLTCSADGLLCEQTGVAKHDFGALTDPIIPDSADHRFKFQFLLIFFFFSTF